MTWTLPSQRGRVIAVTGANGGLGFFTSLSLAAAGAAVVLCCRNPERAEAARRAIISRVPNAQLSHVSLDVASLESVREAGAELAQLPQLDVLIENAGVVHVPRKRQETVDGNEFVIGTNFIGHFALTEAVLPALSRTPGSRIVTLGSIATKLVKPRLDDIQFRNGYQAWTAYAQSKVALQSFAFELDRRLKDADSTVVALAAHPGYAISGRSPWIAGVNETTLGQRFVDNLQWPWAQGKDRGALPILRAASDPVTGGEYFGPRYEVKGDAVRAAANDLSRDSSVASAFWAEAERASGVSFL